VKRLFAAIILRIRKPNVYVPLATFILGGCVGFTISGRAVQPATASNNKIQGALSQSITQLSPEDEAEQLQKGYEYSKAAIERDKQANRINKEQAQALTQKIDEIYTYRKSVIGKNDKREELQTKRQEWREWAREQRLSTRYFTRLYQ